jgi:hypothetical protein
MVVAASQSGRIRATARIAKRGIARDFTPPQTDKDFGLQT